MAEKSARRAVSAFDVVVLVGSAGGLHAVIRVLQALPANFPAAVLVALHRPVDASGVEADSLHLLLAWRSKLPVRELTEEDTLMPGTVSVLPPRTLLATTADGWAMRRTESFRTIDATMLAVAERYGGRCIGVVLTGKLDDGARGAQDIKRRGGRILVQDPDDAQFRGMPNSVLATGSVDFVLPLRRLSAAIVALTMAPGAAELLQVPRSAWAN